MLSRQLSRRASRIPGSIIDASVGLLQSQTHDVVRFAMGSPGEEAIPVAVLEQLCAEEAGAASAFDYGPTEGEATLRAALLAFLGEVGLHVAPEGLLVTAGGMQGLDLAGKLLVDPGDLVAVEGPTYTNGVATISSYEGDLLEVSTDEDGMDVGRLSALAEEAGRPPSLIYVIPNFQNPTGATMSLERRQALVKLAADWDAVILEDDPYGLLSFEGRALPSIASLAPDSVTVVQVFTFSKIIAPGLRVGWVVAPPELVARMVDAKQGMDTCTNVPMQRVVARFLSDGHMHRHLDELRPLYRERHERMQRELSAAFGGCSITWTEAAGGFFLWLRLPPEIDTTELFPIALREGVAYIPGAAFSSVGSFRGDLRLCFASTGGDRIAEGVHRLQRALDLAYPEWQAQAGRLRV